MIKYIATFVLLLFYNVAFAVTIPADSANRADVATAIALSDYGDTVTIPAGTGTGWTSNIAITKDIKIIGNGIDSTILTLGFTNNNVFEGFFNFTPDATARSRLNLLSGAGTFEVTGITFAGNNRMTNKFGVYIQNPNTTVIRRVKIHSNKYTNIHRAVYGVGNIYGVFYNNTLISSNAAYPIGYNKDSWDNNAIVPGGGDGWYIEDNTFSSDTLNYNISGGGHGMGQVVRYNTATGSSGLYVEAHGNQPSGVYGTQVSEIYGNNFNATATQNCIDIRGGKALVFFNKLYWQYTQLREEYADVLTGTALNNACPEDTPQIPTDSCVCMKVNHSYLFNNRKISTNAIINFPVNQDDYNTGVANDPPELVENREFWNYNASFDGTTGMGCGTLAARPVTCTVGVGYWATNQSCTDLTGMVGASPAAPISGTLYRCTSTNVWTAHYTPYAYPHPLRSESEADVTAPAMLYFQIESGAETATAGFSEVVTHGAGGNGGWALSLSGGACTATYASGAGTSILAYTLSRPVLSNETGTATYTQPGNGVEDSAGNDLATTSNAIINNSSLNPPAGVDNFKGSIKYNASGLAGKYNVNGMKIQ